MSTTTTRRQVALAAAENGEKPEDLRCFYHPHIDDGNNWGYWDGGNGVPETVECRGDELPDRKYDSGYGGVEGEPVICFSERYVYFRTGYDGSEWIDSMPISPDHLSKRLPHYLGGG